ncbi:hypothetical protein V6N11_077576 [Hibiscus sabdariffa]|uniref:K+ potassium transporter integral membrane domain-containing protein n=1 Tax=Hibiscus sabdariffa TaxID=183260 RepID=A0ABR2TDT5_9ROSI
MAMSSTTAEEESHIRVDLPMSGDKHDGNILSRLGELFGSKELISIKAAPHNGGHGSGSKDTEWWVVLNLAFQSIGVVYGDIGTSPLYVSNGIKHRDDVLGVLSLVFYTLTLLSSAQQIPRRSLHLHRRLPQTLNLVRRPSSPSPCPVCELASEISLKNL